MPALRYLPAALLLSIVAASATTEAAPPKAEKKKRPKVTYEVTVDREQIQPGKPVYFAVKFHVEEGAYFYSPFPNEKGIGVPVRVQAKGPADFGFAKVAYPAPEEKTTEEGKLKVYKHDVVVPARLKVPANAKVGERVEVVVSVRLQFCDEIGCLTPTTKEKSFSLTVVGAGESPKVDAEVEKTFTAQLGESPESLTWILALAFVAGLALNVMPCVLPVIAIKVLSFVQHAGESRGRMLLFNLVYAIGVISVFVALATLTVAVRNQAAWASQFVGNSEFSWGSQFQSKNFNLGMACLVFAMGLSLLGVFEIPLPGFIGTAASKSEREGLLGVFLSGVMATLLATPCVGPFLSPVMAWSLDQAPSVTYVVWITVGLGLAFPYLVLGLFPGFVRFLPKPGNWMVTFKQFAGFLLLATVIFLLNNIKGKENVVTALFLLLGIGLALWLVGSQINILTAAPKKWLIRALAVALALGTAWLPNILYPKKLLPWQPFSEALFQKLVSENKPVLIDFTADWCLNCKLNEHLAIETQTTLKLIQERGIVPLLADKTEESAEIEQRLRKFGAEGIPLTVVVPAGDEFNAQILDGPFTQASLVKAIETAVPASTPSGDGK